MGNWQKFIYDLARQEIDVERKIVQLSQAIIESGYGTSELFLKHSNPYGLKYRAEMFLIADPIIYKDDNYCAFKNEESAVVGYWMFLNRPVYKGWQQYQRLSYGLLKHLIKCGYVGNDVPTQDAYYQKVISKFNESFQLIRLAEWIAEQ